MTITFSVAQNIPKTADVRVIFVCPGKTSSVSGAASKAASKTNSQAKTAARVLLESKGFKAKAGEVEIVTDAEGHLTAVVGLGDSPTLDEARNTAATLARVIKRHSTAVCLPPDFSEMEEAADTNSASGHSASGNGRPDLLSWSQALAEGIVLGSYEFNDYKSKPEPSKLRKITVISPQQRNAVRDSLKEGARIAEAVCLTRDLVNEPGGSLTPEVLARRAQKVAQTSGLKAEVWSLADIKRQKLGGLLGVNRGSEKPPRFVKLQWNPPGKPTKSIALVGKGVTFDSGGLSLKPWKSMAHMKNDMAGAAAVIGAMSALSEIKPKCRVTGYLPLTDNMTGGDATRVGDVLQIRNKKTVEILNTDAEGRLILADALSLASEDKPDAIVDLATLTGACVVALGDSYAGIMGNDDSWIEAVQGAAKSAGERLWPLPLPEDYRKQLDSPVADMANIGSGNGGTITAGLFLSEFVADGIPWVHLDIAGTAFSDKVSGVDGKGGTGFGVRTLIELVRNF